MKIQEKHYNINHNELNYTSKSLKTSMFTQIKMHVMRDMHGEEYVGGNTIKEIT